MRIQGLIFDYGGVLLDMRFDVCRLLEAEHNLRAGAIAGTLYASEHWHQIQVGAGDRETWLRDAHAALEEIAGCELPPLHQRWRQQQDVIAPNIELIQRLRPPYRTAVLSNADSTLPQRLRDSLIWDLFDDVVCSAEVALAKPDPRIYALAAERLGLPPEACVFVDDLARNVDAARETGMHGIVFRIDEGHDLAAQLAELGVRPAR